MAPLQLSLARARRLALGAQGFGDARPIGRIDRRHLRRVFDRVGVIQIDSVNVLVRSQELPLFARLGPHPRTLIADASDAGEVFEYGVHEASFVPSDDYHLYRWSMRMPHRWPRLVHLAETRPDYVEEVYRLVADNGPVVSGELNQRIGPEGYVVGLGRRQDRARGAVPLREAHCSPAAQRLRPCVRPGRADAPSRRVGAAAAARGRGPQGAPRACCQAPRGRHARGPHRLPPPAQTAVPAADRRAGGGGPPDRRHGRGMEAAGLRAPRHGRAAADLRAGLVEPIRLGGLEPRPDRAAVRVPVPHRDLRAAAEAAVRLLRAAVPAGRRARRAS